MSSWLQVFLSLSAFSSIVITDYCPSNFKYLDDQSLCLLVADPSPLDDGGYESARHRCALQGATLPQIQDVFLNSLLADMANTLQNGQDSSFLIGVIRGSNGQWTYADGSRLAYTRWASGEPSDQFNCAVMDNTSYWSTRDCSQSSSYSCLTPSVPKQRCADDWIHFNGNCYFLPEITLDEDGNWNLFNFADAQQECSQRDAQLVSIHSQGENDFIYDLVYARLVNQTENGYGHPCDYGWTWIGLSHIPSPNSTFWLDGSPLDYCGFGEGDCVIAEMYECGFQVHNDVTCYPSQPKMWNWWLAGFHYSRFICKKATIQ